MTYKVSVSSGNNYSVKFSQPVSSSVTLGYNLEIMPQRLNELSDVEISGNNNQYVLMYDAASGKWKDMNPDAVISAASTEPIQPGFPLDFMAQMESELDNQIDLDAGSF